MNVPHMIAIHTHTHTSTYIKMNVQPSPQELVYIYPLITVNKLQYVTLCINDYE